MKITTIVATGVLCTASAVAMAQQTGTTTQTDQSATQTDRSSTTQSDRTRTQSDSNMNTQSGQSSDRRMADAGRSGMKVDAPEFAKKAAAAGHAEVAMGKLGAQKATDPEVKAYAERMVKDHTTANKELMAAAKAKNLETPMEPDLMHKGMMEKFERQKADKDFDHDFMQQMVRDHEKVIELYQAAANDTSIDADMRALAKKTLPTLQQHLKDAQRLEQRLGQ